MIERVSSWSASLVLLALALLSGLSSPVRADVAVIVPPHAEAGTNPDFLELAVEELTRLLKVHGFDVISAGQAGPAAEAEQQRGSFPQAYDPLYCLTANCANEYRKLFDAIFAVQLSLASRGQRPSVVSVVLTESPKEFFGGTAPVEGGDVRSAVRAAFEAARDRQEEGAGPWLTVSGTPEGAQVYIDGNEYGRVPFAKRHVEPGAHRLEVRAQGYAGEQRAVTVPSSIDHVETVKLSLKPLATAAAGSAPPPVTARRRGVWDWALGGTIAAVGAAHLAAGIYQKSKAGDCADTADGRCTFQYGDTNQPSRENLLIGLGAAGVALGAGVIAFGPITRIAARAQRDSALVQFGGKF